jgi:hypothetical protein
MMAFDIISKPNHTEAMSGKLSDFVKDDYERILWRR